MILSSSITGCPDGYESSPGGGCYYFFSEGRTYDVARRNCLGDPEGDLVIVDDQDELNYLMTTMSNLNNNESWWIGEKVHFQICSYLLEIL